MRPTLVALSLLPLLGGCAAAVLGVGAGVVISQEVAENNSHVAHLNEDPARVWVVTKSTLSHLASEPIHVDEDPLTCVVRGVGRILDEEQKYWSVLSA